MNVLFSLVIWQFFTTAQISCSICQVTVSKIPTKFTLNIPPSTTRGRRQRGAGGPCPPWIFIEDKDIVDRGLIVLVLFRSFFAIFRSFSLCPHPCKRRDIFRSFFRWPSWKFFADALVLELLWSNSKTQKVFFFFCTVTQMWIK